MDFKCKGDHIELIKLLKHLNLVESGGMAKQVVSDGRVQVNGEVELRKRRKLVSGDLISFEGNLVTLS
jgi:ribosome-associated protein